MFPCRPGGRTSAPRRPDGPKHSISFKKSHTVADPRESVCSKGVLFLTQGDERTVALPILPTTALPGTDFDPYVWDPDLWLAIELCGGVCRPLLADLREALDAYAAVAFLGPEHEHADVADPLVLTLLGLVSEQRIASPAKGFHLLQCLGAQLYRLDGGRQRLDPLLYWTNLCGKSQGLLASADAQTLGGRVRRSVAAWLGTLGVNGVEDEAVVQATYRLTIPHLKRTDTLLRAALSANPTRR